MKPTDRQKVCSQCDGRIPMNAKECIYCGTEQPPLPETPIKEQSLNDSLSSFYTPPYATSKPQNYFDNQEGHYSKADSQQRTTAATLHEEKMEENLKSNFLSLFLIVIGTNLFTIGLLQLFFSTDGYLTLEWDSSYWFFYCLIAIPMCYFGYKKTSSNP